MAREAYCASYRVGYLGVGILYSMGDIMNRHTIESIGWIVAVLCVTGVIILGMLLDAGVIR